jgi:RNA-directed DNA polymerase
VLDGLQATIFESIKNITSSKKLVREYKQPDGGSVWFQLKIVFVRYAADFVVIAASRNLLDNYILPKIKEFLNIRGVKLSEEKTKIYNLKRDKLNFLGYCFHYEKH